MAEAPDIRFAADPAAKDDTVLPFQVEALDVRGRAVRLGPLLDAILHRHAYPAAVSRLLGEAVVLTALLGSSLKFEGRFQLQTRTDGAVDMLVVDFTAPSQIRGYARFDEAKLRATTSAASTAQLLGNGHLGLTIDQGPQMQRYQGLVPLEGQGLEEAAHQYFLRSEQIPTRVRLAVAEEMSVEEGAKVMRWRAGGVVVQFLPQSTERQRQAEFDPGDAPAPSTGEHFVEDESWVEARALAETIEDHELVDPALSAEGLLYRLFHERGVRVFEPTSLVERCRCSSERIREMLKRFSPEEKQAMVGDDGQIGVTCEFCSTRYHIPPGEVD
jgi:molecular chaperone Hsp33